MTPEEITASVSLIKDYESQQYLIGLLSSFIVGMAGGFIWYLRESRAERKEMREEFKEMQSNMLTALDKINEVMSRNNTITEKLVDVVDRNEKAIVNLERSILQKVG